MKGKKKILIWVGAIIVIGLLGFFWYQYYPQHIELSQNPNYLFDPHFNPNQVTLYGIKIGDPQSKINPATISVQSDASGWIHTTNGVGYRIANGKVVELVLNWDFTSKIGLNRQDQIEIQFGKPDSTDTKPIIGSYMQTEYNYISRGLIVSYAEVPNPSLGSSTIQINILGK